MRKLLVFLAIGLLAGAGIHQVLASQRGFLLLSLGNYVVETSLWGAFLFVLLLLAGIYLMWKAWKLAIYPRRWWQSLAGRKQLKVRNQTVQGVLDFLEGNWPSAIENLQKGAGRSETPVLNYLGAAAASFNLGDSATAETLLRQAEERGFCDPLTAGLLRVRMFLKGKDFASALALVQTLHRSTPGHPAVLRLLASARKGMRDWQGLELLLVDLKKHKAISSDELAALEREVYRELIDAFGATKSHNRSIPEQQGELDHLWDRLPRRLQNHPELVTAYVRQLLKLGVKSTAEGRLRRLISQQWDENLVELYGLVEGDASQQLTAAEGWLNAHPDSGALLHTLARICVRNQLWGKAREYFDAAIKRRPSPQLWLELGELLQILQDARGSSECYRKGLLQAME